MIARVRLSLRNALCALSLVALGCASGAEDGDEAPVAASIAHPLSGLDVRQMARFQRGTQEFLEVETAAEGLGPLFNGASCSQCHSAGGLGGGGVLRVMRAVCQEADGSTSEPKGGSLIHLFSTRPDIASAEPPNYCTPLISQRRSTPLFGAGLLEAIADDTLQALADSQPAYLRGRVAWIDEPSSKQRRAGRFGWKAQHATLRAFAADAYRNELGITNELFPDEAAPHGDKTLLAAMDAVPDPEARVGAIDALSDFMRFLAPIAPSTTSVDGAKSFAAIGCATCHVPTLRAEKTPEFPEQQAQVYSDLLLHDIGTGDGVEQGAAKGDEFRTAPLWGLRHAPVFLHDGRANSVELAILAHDKQASVARAAFESLSETEQKALVEFLHTL
ncbi:MAG: di-heme oxidoredictase family protein [Polyangiaceae bacterium]